MPAMPLVFYPTVLLWVDDDELFLQAVAEGFREIHKIKTFISPAECINYYKKYQSTSASISFLRGCREHEEYDLNDHLPVDINLNSIFELCDNQQRLHDIAVMIVDFNMPGGMTGIELCRELSGLPIKKILLTGEASHKQAVDAFNEKIIDYFIRKDELALTVNLLSHIKNLHIKYFTEITQPLLSHLEADYKLPQSDPIFIDFFNQWCHDNQVIEYYIVDKNGTFLTININGQSNYFIIHTDQSLNTFVELYNEDDQTNVFVKSVMQRSKIPFFGIKQEPWNFDVSEWENYFYSPNFLNGREKYYWVELGC